MGFERTALPTSWGPVGPECLNLTVPTRQRERQMRKFKTPGQAQRFLTVHGLVQNLFRVGRHLLQAHHHRELRDRAFIVWQEVTCAVR